MAILFQFLVIKEMTRRTTLNIYLIVHFRPYNMGIKYILLYCLSNFTEEKVLKKGLGNSDRHYSDSKPTSICSLSIMQRAKKSLKIP